MPILLLVDDESSVRYTLNRLFSSDEIQVLTAATVAEGVALFRERRPEVVVLDLQLPDGSGLQVFEEVRKIDKKDTGNLHYRAWPQLRQQSKP